jgi:hypothetical protein
LIEDPTVGPIYGPKTIERAAAMGPQVADLVAAVARLPVAVCHSDCHPRNLFPVLRSRRHVETVAIDWASVCLGPIGMDAAPLVGSGLVWTDTSAAQAERIERRVFESYLAGLVDAGWQGTPEHIRLTYLTFLAGDYGGRMGIYALELVRNEKFRAWGTKAVGKPVEEILSCWSDSLRVMFPLMDEAVQLARTI